MTDERVHQVMTESADLRFTFQMDILTLGTYYAVLNYSLQSPEIQAKYESAAQRGAEIKQRLRDILERAGVKIDEEGSFAEEENWQAVCRFRFDRTYEIELDNVDVMLTHELLRTWFMYPPDWQPINREAFLHMMVSIGSACLGAFYEMGFTIEETWYLRHATDDE